MERKRQEAIFELINTEAAYVRDLQLIVEVRHKQTADRVSSDFRFVGLLLEHDFAPD